MDMFDDYGGLSPMGIDPELESALKKCETEEEKQKLMEDYFLTQVKVFVIMLGTLFLVLIFAGIILYFCK
jgi:hypothetical protein